MKLRKSNIQVPPSQTVRQGVYFAQVIFKALAPEIVEAEQNKEPFFDIKVKMFDNILKESGLLEPVGEDDIGWSQYVMDRNTVRRTSNTVSRNGEYGKPEEGDYRTPFEILDSVMEEEQVIRKRSSKNGSAGETMTVRRNTVPPDSYRVMLNTGLTSYSVSIISDRVKTLCAHKDDEMKGRIEDAIRWQNEGLVTEESVNLMRRDGDTMQLTFMNVASLLANQRRISDTHWEDVRKEAESNRKRVKELQAPLNFDIQKSDGKTRIVITNGGSDLSIFRERIEDMRDDTDDLDEIHETVVVGEKVIVRLKPDADADTIRDLLEEITG